MRVLVVDGDPATADIDPVVARRNLTGETPVDAVVFEQVRIGRDGAEVIDRDDLDIL